MTQRHLILMRHGEAEGSAMGGDRERRLTEKGRLDALRRAEWLKHHGYQPQRIISSDALRARETAECLRSGLDLLESVRVDESDAYGADPATLARIIADQPDEVSCLALVAHNPGIGALAGDLMRRSGMGRGGMAFPPAAIAVFEAEGNSWEAALETVRPLPAP